MNKFPKLPILKETSPTFVGKKISVYQLTFPGNRERELVDFSGAAVILPISDEGKILLIKNTREVIGKMLWELPAGTLDEGEMPGETAKRELREETGYEAAKWTPLTAFYSSPGYSNEVLYAFSAEHLRFVGQQLEEGEEISVHALSWKQIMEMIHEGTIQDGKTLTTLLLYREMITSSSLPA